MIFSNDSNLHRLVKSQLGSVRGACVLDMLQIDPALVGISDFIGRAEFAMALNIILFADLIDRVPTGAAYVSEKCSSGENVMFDHGALRTIRFASRGTGSLPAGVDAVSRLLEPLGYVHAKTYPLPALKMTGHAWCHRDLPEAIPQFFVSELHVEQFSVGFQQAADRVFGFSRDPLTGGAKEVLDIFIAHEAIPMVIAAYAMRQLAAAFGRHHEIFQLRDYQILLAESAEAAWIATEGNVFNHATDRVEDVAALADRLRREGKPVKSEVEHSISGRVHQTAFRADQVEREFMDGNAVVARSVPGSFYEFISRDIDPATGKLDLGFDSSNAQGIFAMTKAA